MTTFPSKTPTTPHTATTTTCDTCRKASASSESQPSSSDAKTRLNWHFSNLSPRFRCGTLFIPPGPISHLGFYFDTCEWRVLSVRAWTPAFRLHLTNPCAKRKLLSLTKPKGKIHITKSLGHYITMIRPLPGRNCVSFYRSGLISIWSNVGQVTRDVGLNVNSDKKKSSSALIKTVPRQQYLIYWISYSI